MLCKILSSFRPSGQREPSGFAMPRFSLDIRMELCYNLVYLQGKFPTGQTAPRKGYETRRKRHI